MQEAINDEIDLVELIEIIWNGKWLAGAITGTFALLSLVSVLIFPPSFEGHIDIRALDRTQMAAYAPLNNTPNISQPIYAGRVLIGHEGVIFSEDLFKAFIAKLSQGQFLSEAHAKFDPDFINFDGTETEKRDSLSDLRENYDISIDKSDPSLGTFKFSTDDKELARTIVTSTFKAINNDLRLENLRGVANLKRSIGISLDFRIDEIETAIANALSDYENQTSASLAQLTEQAAIARQLGIADNQAGLAARGANGIGINVNTNLPLYLRGFKALEKEIALTESRGNGDALLPYLPGYPELAARLRRLNTDKRLQRIEIGLALTPLADVETFTAVAYELETMTFKSTSSKGLIVILATLMGSMIAAIFVLMRHFMAQRKLKVRES